jgi:hypothetical protein
VVRKIQYADMDIEVGDYLPAHYFENQKSWAAPNIPINPNLRTDFDSTPNDVRDELEIQHWWMKPYIVAVHYQVLDRDYAAFVDRLQSYNAGGGSFSIMSKVEWSAQIADLKDRWFKAWPSGVRYDVRCLNGGSWDRSSGIGMYATLDEAIEAANNPDKVVDYAEQVRKVLKVL